MSIIRTVLGDISPSQFGVCYAHEHLIIDPCLMTAQSADFLLDSVDLACRELENFHRAGGRALVDAMPIDCGRNLDKLAEISRRTGLHVVASTGLHHPKYYAADHWRYRLDAEEIAEIFVKEIGQGTGIIKVAGGLDRLDDHLKKIFEAAAISHARTGAPILTHTEQGTAALEQVEFLRGHGVAPRHVILSHVDKKSDPAVHREYLSTGAYAEFDSAFRWKPEQGNPTRDLVLSLFMSGLGGQILLGMDAARRGYWKVYGGKPGMEYLLATFAPLLRQGGLAQADLDRLFVTNPATAFSFRSVTEIATRFR